MNKKLFIDIIPYLIIIIVLGAYYYLNSSNNPFNQLGGAEKARGGYPKGTPLLYQFRYIIYLLLIFLIFFNIFYSIEKSKLSTLTIFDAGKVFLKSFVQRQLDIANKIYNKQSPETKEFEKYVIALQIDYAPFSELFCKALAPCSCCGIGKYAPSNAPSLPNSKVCDGVIPVII